VTVLGDEKPLVETTGPEKVVVAMRYSSVAPAVVEETSAESVGGLWKDLGGPFGLCPSLA
jgi:hypothetical protein